MLFFFCCHSRVSIVRLFVRVPRAHWAGIWCGARFFVCARCVVHFNDFLLVLLNETYFFENRLASSLTNDRSVGAVSRIGALSVEFVSNRTLLSEPSSFPAISECLCVLLSGCVCADFRGLPFQRQKYSSPFI